MTLIVKHAPSPIVLVAPTMTQQRAGGNPGMPASHQQQAGQTRDAVTVRDVSVAAGIGLAGNPAGLTQVICSCLFNQSLDMAEKLLFIVEGHEA